MHSISRFHQLVNLLPRSDFDRAVREHRNDRHCKGFRSWDQLLVMLYAQLADSRSLRDVQTGFNLHRRHHYHLATREVRRSTLADANERRNPQPFVDLARTLMAQCGQRLRRERAELTYLLDATSITLKGRGFDEWTHGNGTRFCQGVKLHVIYESQSRTPLVADFTAANVNDVTAAQQLSIEPHATYVFDKGYTDYNWWHAIDVAGARFVTRFKVNAALKTVRELPVEQADHEVIDSDTIVRFANPQPRGGCRNHYTGELRRVVIRRPDGKSLVLATNDLKAPAAQIAQLYRERWQIELFFRWIKQNLKIKSFLGRSQNAVRIQVYTALIAYLLVLLLARGRINGSEFYQALLEIRNGLFNRPHADESAYRRQRERRSYVASVQPSLFPL